MSTDGSMKTPNWPLRGAIGAGSLIIVGGVLGMMAHHLIRPPTAVDRVFFGAHESALVSFQDVLELEDDQMGAIHEILLRHQTRVDHTWETLRIAIQTEVDSAHREIRALLTDDQQTRFEAWLDRHVRSDGVETPSVIWTH